MSRPTNFMAALCLIASLLAADAWAAKPQKKSPQDESGLSKQSKGADAVPAKTAKGVTNSERTKRKGNSPKTSDKRATSAEVDGRSANVRVLRRLPRYFGQLQLDDTQREQAYAIQLRYGQQLKSLQGQIAKLKSEQLQELVGLLSANQARDFRELSQRRTTTRITPSQEEKPKKKAN